MFAVRRTRPGVVHLVGTAAGPLGGDVLEVRLHVAAGATLTLRSAAATIALPHRDGGFSQLLLEAVVEDGGHLDVGLEPLVACSGADVRSTTVLDLAGSATATVVEQVVLGRHGEDGGTWSGRTLADRQGAGGEANPLLRHTLRSDLVAPAGARAIASSVHLGPCQDGTWVAATSGVAVATPLAAGGLVVTSIGPDLATATRDHDAAAGLSAGAGHQGRAAPRSADCH
jgi:urease accessory protein